MNSSLARLSAVVAAVALVAALIASLGDGASLGDRASAQSDTPATAAEQPATTADKTSRCRDTSGSRVNAARIVAYDDPTSSHLVACKIGRAIASKAEPDGGAWLVSTEKIGSGGGARYTASYARFQESSNPLTWWKWVCIGGRSRGGTRDWRCGRALGGLDSVTFRTSATGYAAE